MEKAYAEQWCCSWHWWVCWNSCCDWSSLTIKCWGEKTYIFEFFVWGIFIVILLLTLFLIIKQKIRIYLSEKYKNKSFKLYENNNLNEALFYIDMSLKYNIDKDNLRIKFLILSKLNNKKEADEIFKKFINYR